VILSQRLRQGQEQAQILSQRLRTGSSDNMDNTDNTDNTGNTDSTGEEGVAIEGVGTSVTTVKTTTVQIMKAVELLGLQRPFPEIREMDVPAQVLQAAAEFVK
jgi:hypothetical protein